MVISGISYTNIKTNNQTKRALTLLLYVWPCDSLPLIYQNHHLHPSLPSLFSLPDGDGGGQGWRRRPPSFLTSLPPPHQNPSPPISASRFHFLPHCSAPPPFSCFIFRRATTVDGEKEVKLRPFEYFSSHASILKWFLMVPFPFQFLFCPTLGGGHFPAKRTNFRRPTVARDGKNAHQDWVSLRWVSFPISFSLGPIQVRYLGRALCNSKICTITLIILILSIREVQ